MGMSIAAVDDTVPWGEIRQVRLVLICDGPHATPPRLELTEGDFVEWMREVTARGWRLRDGKGSQTLCPGRRGRQGRGGDRIPDSTRRERHHDVAGACPDMAMLPVRGALR